MTSKPISQKPEWLSLPAEKNLSTTSTIHPGQRNPWTTSNSCSLITPAKKQKKTKKKKQKNPAKDYAKERVGRYAQYFEKDRILQIPDIWLEDQEIGWAKERDLRGALKDRRRPMSVLFQAKFCHMGRPAALGGSIQKAVPWHNNNKVFSGFSPNVKATGELGSPCATSRSNSMEISSPPTSVANGGVDVLPWRSAEVTAHGDYIINTSLNRKGFQSIPHIIADKDQNTRGTQ